jgi:acyl dehydratase
MSRTLDGIGVGDVLPTQTFPVVRADLVRYAGASGDFNPIHWSEQTAVSVGLPDVIAHGMLTMALACRVVTDWVGDPGAVLEYGVRFTRPVVVGFDNGAELEVRGSVTAVDPAGVVSVDVKALSNGQTVLAKATVKVRVPSGEPAIGEPS